MARKVTMETYFFLEWLILEKNMTEKKFKELSLEEKDKLNAEYMEFKNKSILLNVG